MYPGYEQYRAAIRQAPDQPLPMTGRLPHRSELRWSEFAQRRPHDLLSTTLQGFAWPQTRVLRHADAVRDLKAEAGRDIDLMGGATLVSDLLDAGRRRQTGLPLFSAPGRSGQGPVHGPDPAPVAALAEPAADGRRKGPSRTPGWVTPLRSSGEGEPAQSSRPGGLTPSDRYRAVPAVAAPGRSCEIADR